MPDRCGSTKPLTGTVVDPIFVNPSWSLEDTYAREPRPAIYAHGDQDNDTPALVWSILIGLGLIVVLSTAIYVVARVVWQLAHLALAL